MAKRRVREAAPTPPEKLTPEERRAQRQRERAQRKSGRPASGRSGRWRRAALIGGPLVAIGIVASVLVIAHLPTPCITLVPVPATSGVPAFPDHTNPQFATSWCPSASEVYGTAPLLAIDVSGSTVAIPALIGMNHSYPGGATCNLPIVTEPSGSGLKAGTLSIISDWNYAYNLTTFFNIWSETFSAVAVDASHTHQPITYQSNNILGFTSNATDSVYLFVDGQPSSQGPLLEISTLDNVLTTYPSCLGQIYGMGHSILITYAKSTTSAYVPLAGGAVDASAPANPEAGALLFNGAQPHFGFLTPIVQGLAKVAHAGLPWLSLRSASA